MFCTRLAAIPGGRRLGVIIAEAARHGVTLGTRGAATVRDGPLAAVLAELAATGAASATVTALAKDGRDIADATAALLVHRLFLKLQTAGELEPRELEQLGLLQIRLQAGIHRTRRLEADLHALKEKLALREKELALAREKFEEQVKAGVEKGLDALLVEIKAKPGALEAWKKLRATVAPDKQTEAAA